MRETTIRLEFDLQKPGAKPVALATPGLTKSAKAGDPTEIHLDPATTPLPVVGERITIDKTGWPSIDGKMHVITAVEATPATGTPTDLTVKIAADTFAETAALPTTLTDIEVTPLAFDHVCLSEFTPNPGTPGEVDATTMCDTARVSLPGLPTPGTASFTGMFDLDDAGMKALQAAEEDALPRYLIARTRKGQQAIFHGVVSAFSIGGLGVEQAVTFTGNFTLDRRPTYAKAA